MARKPDKKRKYPNRLRELRVKAGYNAEHFANLMGMSNSSLWRLETGEQSLTDTKMRKAGEILDCDPAEIMLLGPAPVGRVPLVGYIGRGSLYYADAKEGPWGEIDQVSPPPAANDNTVAVRVVTDELGPTMPERCVVYFDMVRNFVPEAVHGKLCIVELPDGRTWLAKIQKADQGWLVHPVSGSRHFTRKIQWAAPVRFIGLE